MFTSEKCALFESVSKNKSSMLVQKDKFGPISRSLAKHTPPKNSAVTRVHRQVGVH